MNKKTTDNDNDYSPNHIPASERSMNIILSSILLLYGTVGIMNDDLYLPGKRRPGIHLHGEPAWIMYGAFLFAVANMISVVVDHYDWRNNETDYKFFARVTQVLGWSSFALAFILDLFVFHKGTR